MKRRAGIAVLTVVFGMTLLSPACNTPRTLQGSTTPADLPELPEDQLWKALDTARFAFTTFSAKADLEITDSRGKSSAIAFIRLYKDSLIWISFRKAGLEGARLLITRDSVHLLDRTEKVYYPLSLGYFAGAYQLPLDFRGIQDMLCGNVLVPRPLNWTSAEDQGRYTLSGKYQDLDYCFWISPGDLKLRAQSVNDRNRKRTVLFELNDWTRVGSSSIAAARSLSVDGEEPFKMSWQLSRMSSDEPDLSFSFQVSSQYAVRHTLP